MKKLVFMNGSFTYVKMSDFSDPWIVDETSCIQSLRQDHELKNKLGNIVKIYEIEKGGSVPYDAEFILYQHRPSNTFRLLLIEQNYISVYNHIRNELCEYLAQPVDDVCEIIAWLEI